ncbi:MAG: hypothetical protein Q4G58_04455 [bacterium]|nr:hypothetical protein [bacterium]
MNILLAGSGANENSSKLLLDLIIPKYYIDKIYLSEQLDLAKERVISRMRHKTYDYVFLFEMNTATPATDQVTFEVAAKLNEIEYKTNYEYDNLYEFLKQRQFHVKVSEKSVQGIANDLYYEALQMIYKNAQSTKCILISVPEVAQINVMKLAYNIINYFNTPLKVL